MRDDELIEAVTAPNQTIAAMWARALELRGIPATVRCRDALAVTASISSPLPCSVMVLKRDIGPALSLLAQIAFGETTDDRPEE